LVRVQVLVIELINELLMVIWCHNIFPCSEYRRGLNQRKGENAGDMYNKKG
jgi:hypothetical protein